MRDFFRYFVRGIGAAVCLFPARGVVCEAPVTGDYFANVGEHFRRSLKIEGAHTKARRREGGKTEGERNGVASGVVAANVWLTPPLRP